MEKYKNKNKGLRYWFEKENWVRINTKGDIVGPCGTSKNPKNPDRCLPRKKAESLTKSERASTARKKKAQSHGGRIQFVPNTKKAQVNRKLFREIIKEIFTQILEKKKSKKDDRCTRVAKRVYDSWPSAYASGAVVRCRRGEIWKDKK